MNPHDICYVEIDATSKHYQLPVLSPDDVLPRENIARAMKQAEIARQSGAFDSLCPPLVQNHGITENAAGVVLKTYEMKSPTHEGIDAKDVYRFLRYYVKNEWTVDDWRMHHWIYHRLTEYVDSQIGVILDALYEKGLDKNTIIIFTSDHGDMDGAHKLVHKGDFYDESSRVPFIVSGSNIKKGVDVRHLISSSLDLLPTICEFAGSEVPEGLYGKSIKPLVYGDKNIKWRDAVYSENDYGRMVRTIDYKYCIFKEEEPCEMPIDMKNDHGEMKNIAVDPKYSEIIEKHRQIINMQVKNNKDTLFIPGCKQ